MSHNSSDSQSDILESLSLQLKELNSSSLQLFDARTEQPENEPKQKISDALSNLDSFEQRQKNQHAQNSMRQARDEGNDTAVSDSLRELSEKLENQLKMKDYQLEQQSRKIQDLQSRISFMEAEAEKLRRDSTVQRDESMQFTKKLGKRLNIDVGSLVPTAELRPKMNQPNPQSCTKDNPRQMPKVMMSACISSRCEVEKYPDEPMSINLGKIERRKQLTKSFHSEQQTTQLAVDGKFQKEKQKEQVADLEAKNLKLQAEVTRLQAENDRLKTSETQVTDQSTEFKNAIQKIESLEMQQKEHADEQERLSKQLGELEAKNIGLKEELQRLQEKNNQLKSSEAHLTELSTQQQEDIQNSEALIERQKEQIARVESKNVEELKRLQEENNQLKVSETQLKEQCTKLQRDIHGSKTVIEQQKEQVGQLETKYVELQEELKRLQKDNDFLKSSKTQMEDRIAEYKKDIQSSNTQLEQQKEQVANLKERNLKLQAELDQLHNNYHQLKSLEVQLKKAVYRIPKSCSRWRVCGEATESRSSL
ncbi:hypothetical protein BOX15_Mlig003505g2 [Macrostomum lignano]|uniref:Uncharacterized protein n=1 Tax=Macrostomum lignano TaxID=282301 RepID=A0A267GDQ6_9PLAT|nr:hypothetical protein BOX15_Mlig003505g2 [Macrostomum lignano]